MKNTRAKVEIVNTTEYCSLELKKVIRRIANKWDANKAVIEYSDMRSNGDLYAEVTFFNDTDVIEWGYPVIV